MITEIITGIEIETTGKIETGIILTEIKIIEIKIALIAAKVSTRITESGTDLIPTIDPEIIETEKIWIKNRQTLIGKIVVEISVKKITLITENLTKIILIRTQAKIMLIKTLIEIILAERLLIGIMFMLIEISQTKTIQIEIHQVEIFQTEIIQAEIIPTGIAIETETIEETITNEIIAKTEAQEILGIKKGTTIEKELLDL